MTTSCGAWSASWCGARYVSPRPPFYSDFGRPGVDPVVLVKVFLVAAIRGVGSTRETLRVAQVDLSIRRFMGYGLTEALPHHATFSYAQCVRFAHSSVFAQFEPSRINGDFSIWNPHS